MSDIDLQHPSTTYRGTWQEALTHCADLPGSSRVEVRVFPDQPQTEVETPTMKLLRGWLAEDALQSPESILEAEADLSEFMRNINESRREVGGLPIYPDAE